MTVRIGMAYDVHPFQKERPLILGGVTIPHHQGLMGHSDADALTHAIMDALLGALSLGTIGDFFPDTDPKYKDADSMVLLDEVAKRISDEGYVIGNIDTMLVCEAPKLAPYIQEIRQCLSKRLGIELSQVSVKPTRSEKMGFIGRQEGLAAHAVILLNKRT